MYCARNCFFMSSSRCVQVSKASAAHCCISPVMFCAILREVSIAETWPRSMPFDVLLLLPFLSAAHDLPLGDMFGVIPIQLGLGHKNCVLMAISQRVNQDQTEQFAIMINECPCKSATSRDNQHRQSC